MTKRVVAGIFMVAALILTACSTDEAEPNPFIEDLEYMIYVLENNFAAFDVANWAHDVDIRELESAARRSILAMEEECRDTFFGIMSFHFLPLSSLGHFNIAAYEALEGWYHSFHPRQRHHLRSPEVQRFYGDMTDYRRDIQSEEFRRLVEIYGHSPRMRTLEEIMNPEREPRVETLRENEIAFISTGISSFDTINLLPYVSDLDLDNFEHIIIDLRGNGGGVVRHYIEALWNPMSNQSWEDPQLFLFFADHYYTRRFELTLDHTSFTATTERNITAITEAYRPIQEILAEFDLPELPIVDRKRLQYGAPAIFRLPYILPNPNSFDGKIWLLVDGFVGSASQVFSWLAKEAGFATLVGETTGGNFGGERTVAFMPNTGIMFQFDVFYITDSRGRPLEAGTIPHHFNRPGMDALQTVLALIEEGEY